MQSNRADRPYFGILLFVGSMIVMVAISALVKHLVDDYPISQVLFFRYLFVAIPMVIMVSMTTGLSALKITRYRDYAIRVSAGLMSLALFFFAISKIPLAEATLLTYISPIFVVILSIPVLGEKNRRLSLDCGSAGVFGGFYYRSARHCPIQSRNGGGSGSRSGQRICVYLATGIKYYRKS